MAKNPRIDALRSIKGMGRVHEDILRAGEKGKPYVLSKNGKKYMSFRSIANHFSSVVNFISNGLDSANGLGLNVQDNYIEIPAPLVKYYYEGCKILLKKDK